MTSPRLPLWRFLLKQRRRRRDRERRISALAENPRPLAFCRSPASLGHALIHLDTYPGRRGMWRVTWLSPEGEPSGLNDARDFRHALELAVDDGCTLIEPMEPHQRAA